MALWTDVIDPASLTGYARESLAAQEARKGTLARFLPNQTIFDTVARFVAGQAGLVEEAKFRAYDAEPEIGRGQGGKRVTLELPALGQNIPVSEYTQLRTRNASDDAILASIQRTTDQVVQAVSDRIERLRGTVLVTGKATIDQDNFKTDDDFGRKAEHTVTASTLWAAEGADPLADLEAWVDVYNSTNGVDPGAIVLSRRVLRTLAAHASFRVQLAGGGSRAATTSDVIAILEGAGLPEVVQYDRRTSAGRVVPDNRLLLLPAPVNTDDADGTELGGTFWGQTLTSTDSNYGIEDAEQPGIVAGVYRNEKPPMIAEVISDAIALPVLANADLSLAATVL
jgi:hypothetical protein